MARKTERIRRLNDRLRRTGQGGAITVTSGLDERLLSRLMLAVATFEAFGPDNDPYGEHDGAGLVVEGHRILWKIDYYDPTLTWLSEDPADPAKTRRVLTVMLSHEY
ncbi:MAG: DUF3768 domain-containing protein [Proteobacteria bacterium]|nr:DUF3768 domain-containing protein [Pseudomonadota bacterium]MCH8952173.1 DUF3768 domain-containing protein [Pseudomonadota bacterium]